MSILFRKSIEKKQMILLCISFIIFSFLIVEKGSTNALFLLLSSHYIALVIDNIYIWIIHTRILKTDSMFDKIITRYTKNVFLKKYLSCSIVSNLIYVTLSWFILSLIVGFNPNYWLESLAYFMIQVVYFTFLELLCMLYLGEKENSIKVSSLFLINLFYHYIFALEIFTKIL